MPEIEWYYPENVDEATGLLAEDGVVLHAGGTGILMAGLSKKKGLIDLRALNLRYIERGANGIEIGAMTTYGDIAAGLGSENILGVALSKAAATPLRNRITIGGSVRMAPVWSDTIGPLVALEARLRLEGRTPGEFKVEDYLANSTRRAGNLITAIILPENAWRVYYHRETRTDFDYPMFTISILKSENDLRIVVTGIKGKFVNLTELADNILQGNEIASAIESAALPFPAKRQASSEYIERIAKIWLIRMIAKAMKGEK